MNINPDTLKFHRERCGLSQEALASVSGVSKKSISRIESGSSGANRQHIIKRLAETLGVTEKDLCQIAEEPGDDFTHKEGSVFRRMTVFIDPETFIAFEFIKQRYNVLDKDILAIAPLLFIILAEASLNWRRKTVSEWSELRERIYKLEQRNPHLDLSDDVNYINYLHYEHKTSEINSIDKGDIYADYYTFQYANPFVEYLKGVSLKHAAGLVDVDHRSEGSKLPAYLIKPLIDNLTGGDDRARYALLHKHARLGSMPADLWGDDAKEPRVAWLAQRVPDEEWEKHQAAEQALEASVDDFGI